MDVACRIERRPYDALLMARPRTLEGMAAMIRYVDEMSQRQIEKGARDDGPAILAANLKETVRFVA
jgi:hypothetical protein